MTATRIFIHGLEGTSQGIKARFFRARFPDMQIADYRGPLEARMATLRKLATGKAVIIVGSSYGGLMGALYALEQPARTKKLILLAPALPFPDFATLTQRGAPITISIPTTIFHGTEDEVIPLEPVREIAYRIFQNLDFHAVRDDHFLSQTFHTIDWEQLLDQPREKRPCRQCDNK